MSKPKRQEYETDLGYEWVYYDADALDAWLRDEVVPVLRKAQQKAWLSFGQWMLNLDPGLDPTFYHTLDYDKEIEAGALRQADAEEIDALLKEIEG